MGVIKTFLDLEVYRLAHEVAMDVFYLTKDYPREEKYSLTDQIRRSSRSVAVNMAEGWGKRKYEKLFKRHLIDSAGSIEETKSWLLFSCDCAYLSKSIFEKYLARYEEVGAKLFKLHDNWRTY